ncbi:Nose resistant to fluoxetine protein 6, partial [Fragariocoptes setiger]
TVGSQSAIGSGNDERAAVILSHNNSSSSSHNNSNNTSDSLQDEHALLPSSEFIDGDSPMILVDPHEPGEEATATAKQLHHQNNVSTTAETTIDYSRDSPILIIPVPAASMPIAAAAAAAVADATTTVASTTARTNTSNMETNDNDDHDDDEFKLGHDNPSSASDDADFEVPKNVSQFMDYIERLFHDLKHQIMDLFEPHMPQLIRRSSMVSLSGACSYDMLRLVLGLRQFQPWALKMLDAAGKVPEGIFEGSFTALGSYDECLATQFEASQSDDGNQPTQGKYCLVNVSPFLPPKPPVDNVEHIFNEEANKRNYPRANHFARIGAIFYYMRFRIGVCIPSTCSDIDTQSIADTLSDSLRLNITIPHCQVKQETHWSKRQWVAGFFVLVLVMLVTISSVVEWMLLRGRNLKKHTNDSRTGSHRIAMPLTNNIGKNNIALYVKKLAPFEVVADSAPRELMLASNDLKLNDGTCNGHLHPGGHINSAFQSDSVSVDINSTATGAARVETTGAMTTTATNNNNDGHGCVERALSIDNQRDNNSQNTSDRSLHWALLSFSTIYNHSLYFKSFNRTSTSYTTFIDNHNNHTRRLSQASTTSHSSTRQQHQSHGHSFSSSFNSSSNNSNHDEYRTPIIKCLNGVRVISLCWVIIANSYVTLDPRATKHLSKTREATRDFIFQTIVQASLAIETFFFLSGLLMSISFVRRLRSSRFSLISWLEFYVHRYVRVTPAAMFVIGIVMIAISYGDGPLWHEATWRSSHYCAQNWWRHLVHVANFSDTRQMCFIHYWYIAADMQLFLVGPIVLFVFYRWPKAGLTLLVTGSLASMLTIFYVTLVNRLPPTLLFYDSDPDSRRAFANMIMTQPYTHLVPYVIGMLVGCAVANNSGAKAIGKTDKLGWLYHLAGRKTSIVMWLAVTCVGLAEIFLPFRWNNAHLPSGLVGALYAATFRLGWSLVLAWLVLACRHIRNDACTDTHSSYSASSHAMAHNRAHTLCFCQSGGGIINQFLSLDIFTSLSRLSYVAYLIHLPLMSGFIAQTRGLFAFSHGLVMHLALSYLVITFFLSFILVYIVEFPFITLNRQFFEFIRRTLRQPHTTTTTTRTS